MNLDLTFSLLVIGLGLLSIVIIHSDRIMFAIAVFLMLGLHEYSMIQNKYELVRILVDNNITIPKDYNHIHHNVLLEIADENIKHQLEGK